MKDDARKITILTVDDHPVLRQGIAALIAAQSDMTLVAEAANGREAIQQFRVHRDEIARIVKETINSLDRRTVADHYDRKQREEIVRTLTKCKGRVGGEDGAAARLGINRTTLLSRMKKFSISAKHFC